jgi:hypothetical protein
MTITVMATAKKKKKRSRLRWVLVAGTLTNLKKSILKTFNFGVALEDAPLGLAPALSD